MGWAAAVDELEQGMEVDTTVAGEIPRDALFDLEQATERGRRIVDVIVAQGIVALTAPNESRFRK